MKSPISRINSKFRFVVDTTAFISYFHDVFRDATPKLSKQASVLIDKVIEQDADYLMVVPNVVFVEIFDKWFRGDSIAEQELRAKIQADVIRPLRMNPNVETREMDTEVLEAFLKLDDSIVNLENRDKFVLAVSEVLGFPLITSDRKIKKYFMKSKNIPALIN